MLSHRKEKVSSILKREISELIRKNLAEKYGLVTLTDIDLTNDFREAKVYIIVHQIKDEHEVLLLLFNKNIEFQRILGKKLKMKFTPRLNFIIDKNLEKIEKIDRLLEEINNGS